MKITMNGTTASLFSAPLATSVLSIALMGTLLSSVPAFAKTNVAEKVQQLKENKDASQANLTQYEDNLKVVNENLAEADKALKALEKQKQALAKQTAETNKGKLAVDAVKKQIDGFMKGEQAKLDAERKQIEELKKTLAQLEGNVVKREQNIVQYQEKMKKVDTELATWSERNQSIVELEQAIRDKENLAKADQKKLADKKKSYEEEATKWRKQTRLAERQYESFAKLKD